MALLHKIRPRAILHLAVDRMVHGGLSEADRRRQVIAPLETLIEGLQGVPGGLLIHTSSVWVLPAGERLDERTKLDPRSPYAKAKAQADQWLPILAEQAGVNWINLRLFNIFGKYESESRLLPYLASRLVRGEIANLSSGEQIRDFIDVDDIALAYLLALQSDESVWGQVFHIGSGVGTSVREFAMTVADVTGNAGLIRFGAVTARDGFLPCQVADPTRARSILGWSPAKDLKLRIREIVAWWLQRWGASVTVNSAMENS
jgi:nucleoside-diphosphate-sugar epimerase